MLKRSQHSLMSIIHSFAQRRFSANNKRLLANARYSTTLSRFGVVSTRIPKYLKVYTRLIMSPSNTNFWHGSTKLNTMTFVFFTFIENPRSAQNCWSAFNCYYTPTFDSDVRARSSAKNNNHMCTSTRPSASHFLPSKHLSKASKYSPNNRQLRG
jgi:hypothetical protein